MAVKPLSNIRKDLGKEKSVHVKLDADLYVSLRVWCLQKGVTMHEVFEDFSRRLVEGDARANGIVDSYILKSLNLPKHTSRIKSRKIVELSESDKSSLYDLINGEIQEESVQGDQEDSGSDNKS